MTLISNKRLTNFYQNCRRYVKSRDDSQLLGDIGGSPSSDCDPFAKKGDKNIVPCGAIANSMFSDDIILLKKDSDGNYENIPKLLIRTGIAWDSDKKYKFKNPDDLAALNVRTVMY